MEIKLLSECPEFIHDLALLHYNQWNWLTPNLTFNDYILKVEKHAKSESLPLTYLAINHNEILGSASLRMEDHDTRKDIFPWLGGVVVKQSERDKGICRILENSICNKARDFKFNKIYLFTFDKENLYSHLGWKYYDKGEYKGKTVTFMSKEI